MSQPAAAPADVSVQETTQSKPLVLSKSVQQLLPILRAQSPHYITAHIHRFPYLLTAGDTLRLPFHMHGVEPGDIIRLNRASLLGSRDYTLKAGTTHTETYDGSSKDQLQYLDERLFECRARVLGVDTGPMVKKEKTKRRNRKVKTAKSKHKYTVLKIMEIKVNDLEELKAEKGDLLLS
jgi:large subunit ribosomal protein L21